MVKVPVGYKLPRWLVEWLRGQAAPAALLIEDALKKQYGLAPPMTDIKEREVNNIEFQEKVAEQEALGTSRREAGVPFAEIDRVENSVFFAVLDEEQKHQILALEGDLERRHALKIMIEKI